MDDPSSNPGMTDEELASNAAAGSRSCFTELVHRYSGRLFHFFLQKVNSRTDAEDLTQDTFLKAYKNIGRFHPEKKFSTWVYTIATRLAISHYRSNHGREAVLPPRSPSTDPREIAVRKESLETLWNLARNLKKDEHDALWLRYMEDMPVKEIARVLKKTKTHVRVLLHRARSGLARAVASRQEVENQDAFVPRAGKVSYL